MKDRYLPNKQLLCISDMEKLTISTSCYNGLDELYIKFTNNSYIGILSGFRCAVDYCEDCNEIQVIQTKLSEYDLVSYQLGFISKEVYDDAKREHDSYLEELNKERTENFIRLLEDEDYLNGQLNEMG